MILCADIGTIGKRMENIGKGRWHMKLTDLRNAVNDIEFDEEKQERLIREIRAGKRKRPRGYAGFTRIAAAAAIGILTVGILSFPVRALVNSLVQERMESLPEEEISQITEQIYEQSTEADSSTREYTEGEKERKAKLYAQYMEGLFPTDDLTQVDSEEEAGRHEFCFLTTTGVFYLPKDRELTDEEILEQIDFEKKRDYALQEQHAEEIAERKAAEREQIQKAVAAGGVTEEQAVEIAEGYLQRIFGFDGSGMELNHYYNNPDPDPAGIAGTYGVNWSDMGSCSYYYFFIDAADGSLRSMSYSHDIEGTEALRPSVSEAPGKIGDIRRQAQEFLEEKLDISESYEEVKSYYMVNVTDERVSRWVDVLFVGGDGDSYLVSCRWDGEVRDFAVDTKEGYEEHLRTQVRANIERYKTDEGREVQIEIVEK